MKRIVELLSIAITLMATAEACSKDSSQLTNGELVDLGLSVKWRSYNLDASKPEEYGGFYSWAGTEDVTDKNIYLYWNNCPYHKGSDLNSNWLKYNTQSSYGTVDNKTVLDPEDDVAHVKLGGKWRIPTNAEWNELLSNCTSEWITLNGIAGIKFTSKKNGNSIFLPAAGDRWRGSLDHIGTEGHYWSSSLWLDHPGYAFNLNFSSDHAVMNNLGRCLGRSVRPVSE